MKTRLTIPTALFVSLLTAALATGNPLLMLLAVMTALTVALSLAGVLWAAATMRVSAEVPEETVYRGNDVSLELTVSHHGWIPIAPVMLELATMTGEGKREIRLKNQPKLYFY